MSILNKKIINVTPPYFGLDISEFSVKVMQVSKHRSHDRVHGFAVEHIPADVMRDGTIVKPDVLTHAIHTACKKAKITTKNVVCSLPESKTFLRIVSLPKMHESEVHEAIKWEIEAVIPLSIDQVYYDWHILTRSITHDAQKMDIIVVAVSKQYVDEYIQMFNDAGLTVYGFELESVAQTMSLLHNDEKGATTMIIDIGDKNTSFVITVDNVPVFTSSIPLSADSITQVIAQTLGITHEKAEEIKKEKGIGSAVKDDHIFQAVRPVADSFVQEAKKSIDFYLSGLTYSQKIDRIIMSGGGSRTKGLTTYLAHHLGYEIMRGDPWVNMRFQGKPPIDKESSVQYTTVIGLALKEL